MSISFDFTRKQSFNDKFCLCVLNMFSLCILSHACLQESGSSWLDSVISHLADIILLEDTPSIQMEVAVLVKEFPDIR